MNKKTLLITSFSLILSIYVYTSLAPKLSRSISNPSDDHSAANTTIKIALVGPMTGGYAAFGEQIANGAKMAVDDINKTGGINNQKVELIIADDACEPKQAVTVANRLEHEGVQAVIGHFCSSSTIPASEIYGDANILMITPASTNPQVTERNIATIFRTCGRDEQQGEVAAVFIHNTLKAKNIAVIHDKDTYGQGIADAMRAKLHQLGINEILYDGLTRGEKDFVALATKIKAIKADAVYFGGMHNEAGPLLKQLREMGVSAPFISGDGISTKDFITSAGGPQFGENVYMTFGADPRKITDGKIVVDKFRKNGYEPEGYTLYAYATVQIISQAMEKTKSVDGAVLANYLRSNPVNTIMGNKAWDKKGDLVKTDFVMYKWDKLGNYEQL